METKKTSNVLSIIGIVLCIFFGFILVCNTIIIAKGTISPERPPNILGTTPMVVLSGSMSGDAEDHIEAGDLIFTKTVDPDTLEKGDIIAFMEKDSMIVTTHRIVDTIKTSDGEVEFVTKGDANNTNDQSTVSKEDVVGVYTHRIPKLGDFAMFLQEPLGMILFIGGPILAFILYDYIRRKKNSDKVDKEKKELEAEVKRLENMINN